MTALAGHRRALLASRLPRRTVRLRLTLLYVGLFLASAAGLLVITYFLVAQQLPNIKATSCAAGTASGPVSITIGNGTAVPAGPVPGQGIPGPGSEVLRTGTGTCRTTSPPGLPARGSVNGYVLYLQQQVAGAQQVAVSLRGDTLDKLLLESGIALGIMAVVSVGLGWLMAGRVLSPLRTITSAARRISARSLHQRIALTGPDDELKELGDTFDDLLSRLEAAFRAQRAFVANASHELRTPLARQRTLLEVALRDKHASNESLRNACQRALAAGEQHERLIAAMLTLAQSERGLDRFEPVDLSDIAEDALLTSTSTSTGAGTGAGGTTARQLTVNAALSPAPTLGDEGLAERLVTNLIDNAIRYNVAGGRLDVATGMRQGRPFLAVTNTGPLVPPDQLTRLFQPFQRLEAGRDATGKGGLGLGLAIVSAIATAHGADLSSRAEPGGGLSVEVTFPARQPAMSAAAAPQQVRA